MTGRNGEPGDFKGVAVFLASPASDYITGQTIYVDGGFSATWPLPCTRSRGYFLSRRLPPCQSSCSPI
jgi:uncharacterized metal-binding protein YceD (DUF177 family)